METGANSQSNYLRYVFPSALISRTALFFLTIAGEGKLETQSLFSKSREIDFKIAFIYVKRARLHLHQVVRNVVDEILASTISAISDTHANCVTSALECRSRAKRKEHLLRGRM